MSDAKLPAVGGRAPVQVELEPGRKYWWCACGLSKKQPLCDGSHKGTGLKPVKIEVEEKTTAWLCTCKRTGNPPYCDGSHKTLAEQEAS
ncbi:MAG: CDGSH iron-sulfur domain-containing protein [Planctomycetota bacterium]|nr:MAG: CDGSH iron-sulfur domain-containing protein [Planctomycetota bacterium]